MKKAKKQSGFTTIELLITLFVAAAFLMSGYQLYGLIIKDSGDARAQAQASNVAFDYLQRYKSSATNPCTANPILYSGAVTVNNLTNATVTVSATCPYSSSVPPLVTVTKIVSTVKYNDPEQSVSSATYVTK